MGDVVGRLFREFAVTLAVTIIISAVVSLTLTPMMCGHVLRHNPVEKQGRFYRASERVFDSMIAFYGRTLRFVLRYQNITILVAAGTLAPDGLSLHHHSQRLFPDPGYRGDPGHFASSGDHLLPGDGAEAAGAGEGHSAGSGGREPLLVHRRGWHQYHAQQRPHLDQPEASFPARSQCLRRNSPADLELEDRYRGSRSTCSRYRTSRSTTVSAAPNINTRSPIRTRPS